MNQLLVLAVPVLSAAWFLGKKRPEISEEERQRIIQELLLEDETVPVEKPTAITVEDPQSESDDELQLEESSVDDLLYLHSLKSQSLKSTFSKKHDFEIVSIEAAPKKAKNAAKATLDEIVQKDPLQAPKEISKVPQDTPQTPKGKEIAMEAPKEIVSKDIPKNTASKKVSKEIELKDTPKDIAPKQVIKEIELKDTPSDIAPKQLVKEIELKDTPKDIAPKKLVKEIELKDTPKDIAPKKLVNDTSKNVAPKNSIAAKEIDSNKASFEMHDGYQSKSKKLKNKQAVPKAAANNLAENDKAENPDKTRNASVGTLPQESSALEDDNAVLLLKQRLDHLTRQKESVEKEVKFLSSQIVIHKDTNTALTKSIVSMQQQQKETLLSLDKQMKDMLAREESLNTVAAQHAPLVEKCARLESEIERLEVVSRKYETDHNVKNELTRLLQFNEKQLSEKTVEAEKLSKLLNKEVIKSKELSVTLDDRERVISSLKYEVAQLVHRIETFETQSESFGEERDQMNAELVNYKASEQLLRQEISILTLAKTSLESSLEKANNDLALEKKNCATISDSLIAHQKASKKELETLKADHEQTKNEYQDFVRKSQEFDVIHEKLQLDYLNSQKEVAALNEQASSSRLELLSLENTVEELNQAVRGSDEGIARNGDTLKGLEDQVAQLKSRISILTKESTQSPQIVLRESGDIEAMSLLYLENCKELAVENASLKEHISKLQTLLANGTANQGVSARIQEALRDYENAESKADKALAKTNLDSALLSSVQESLRESDFQAKLQQKLEIKEQLYREIKDLNNQLSAVKAKLQ